MEVLAKTIADEANRTDKKGGNLVEKKNDDVATLALSLCGGKKKKGDDKKRTYWKCGEVGHFKQNCKKKDSESASKGKEKEFTALVESVDTNSDWEVNSKGKFGVNNIASESGMTLREMPDFVKGDDDGANLFSKVSDAEY